MKKALLPVLFLIIASVFLVGCSQPMNSDAVSGSYAVEKGTDGIIDENMEVPQGLNAWYKTPTSLTVGWQATSDSNQGYAVYLNDVRYHATVTGTSYTFTGLTFGETYTVKVAGIRLSGMWSYESNTSTPINVTMDTTLTPPTGVTITRISDKSISLIWDESTHPDKKGYHIHYNGKIVGTKNNYITLTDLDSETLYNMEVKVYGLGSAISEPSETVSISTLATTTAPLATPTGVRATAVTNTTITITWDHDSDPAVTSHLGGIASVLRIPELGPGRIFESTTDSITFTDLEPNTVYEIIVAAQGENNIHSNLAEPIFVTTAASAFPFPAWDAAAVYTGGELVVHNGWVYTAKWWTQGNEPGTEEWGPWNPAQNWGDGITYATGDVVIFEGNVYVCLQGHTALNNWIPTITPALWQLQ